MATLDVLSNGRLTVGLGVGGREEDYRVLDVEFARRHARMDAVAGELRRLWQGEPSLPGAAPVGPAPIQPGGPPLWVGAAGPKALGRAARWADGVAGFSLGPDEAEMAALFRAADQAWRQAGRPQPPTRSTSFWYALGRDPRGQLDAYVERYLAVFGRPAVEALRARCQAAGRPAVADAVRRARDAGADELFLVPTSADLAELDELASLLESA
jgi:alkanesulfonate monooxygenase SsuD/methylene tetrahydromethanopterin reductase-like flavin-dependent oxidoreductase (luciferase family)